MGQKSNLLTLRLNYNINTAITPNSKLFVSLNQLLKFLERLFFYKSVIVCNSSFHFENNILYIFFNIFYNIVKISFYKNRLFTSYYSLSQKLKNDFVCLFKNSMLFFRVNTFLLFFKVLNHKLSKNVLGLLFKELKKFIAIVFSRRFRFMIDFLKITILFVEDKININIFLLFIANIFKFLSKRKHNKFFLFLKYLFNFMVNNISALANPILGIKFILGGRIRGKDRSSTKLIQLGKISTQSIEKNISFFSCSCYTLYGVFGLKMWILRKNNILLGSKKV
jgi:hypothetical protein